MQANIVVLPGDGIGPEIIAATVPVLEAIARRHGHQFQFHEHDIGGIAIDRPGVPMQLESYQVHSIGIGADARGEANLSVRCDGVEHAGLGTSRDIIEASALAWLDVANRVIRQREAASTSLAATA